MNKLFLFAFSLAVVNATQGVAQIAFESNDVDRVFVPRMFGIGEGRLSVEQPISAAPVLVAEIVKRADNLLLRPTAYRGTLDAFTFGGDFGEKSSKDGYVVPTEGSAKTLTIQGKSITLVNGRFVAGTIALEGIGDVLVFVNPDLGRKQRSCILALEKEQMNALSAWLKGSNEVKGGDARTEGKERESEPLAKTQEQEVPVGKSVAP